MTGRINEINMFQEQIGRYKNITGLRHPLIAHVCIILDTGLQAQHNENIGA